MQTTQINLKLDSQVKTKLQAAAKKLGLNASNVLRKLIDDFLVDPKISFSAEKKVKRISQKQFVKDLIAEGYSKKEAEAEAQDYHAMLDADEKGELIRVL